MDVVILAGGRGTRLAEETIVRPKPMVEIGGHPILWHIMRIYASHGFRRFCVACGYKGEMIKEYFHSFLTHNSDLRIDLASGRVDRLNASPIDWQVTLVDTGLDTMTAGRIRRVIPHLEPGPFLVTYGDGLGNIDVTALVRFHQSHGKLATVTAVRPPARFGDLQLDGDRVAAFAEKPQTEEGWINGGFFLFERAVLEYLDGDTQSLERGPLDTLASAGQLMAFKHAGFWQPMDTVRERDLLESLWASGQAPWKTWT
jgi:glucose-1-phosphate cytidylyltransferase